VSINSNNNTNTDLARLTRTFQLSRTYTHNSSLKQPVCEQGPHGYKLQGFLTAFLIWWIFKLTLSGFPICFTTSTWCWPGPGNRDLCSLSRLEMVPTIPTMSRVDLRSLNSTESTTL